MSVIPIDTTTSAANGAAKPRVLWQRFAQALDRLVAYRIKRSVPEIMLRRSKRDFDRRLMLQGSMVPVRAGINRGSLHGPVQTL